MTARTPEIFGSSIVVIGAFNPMIFTPDWLERNELIGQDDANAARQQAGFVVSHDVCQLETDWFALQVIQDRFSLTSKGALNPALKDLAVGIFTLLAHTPVTAAGFNFFGHYKIAGETAYHKIGDTLAPKTIWGTLYPNEDYSFGLAELTVLIQPHLRGEIPTNGDTKRITVQPSGRVKGYGVCLSLNDHHVINVNETDALTAAEQVAELIDLNWQDEWKESLRIFDDVITKALGI